MLTLSSKSSPIDKITKVNVLRLESLQKFTLGSRIVVDKDKKR